jgi:hypothetical protein
MALALEQGVADAIRQHGADTYPNECCGAIIGREGRVTATYGFGSFNSELPIKTLTEDVRSGPAKTINAIMGGGDATLRLTTNSGAILIKKL